MHAQTKAGEIFWRNYTTERKGMKINVPSEHKTHPLQDARYRTLHHKLLSLCLIRHHVIKTYG
jgi:uncharacterized protein YqjF (DUF2071 family)